MGCVSYSKPIKAQVTQEYAGNNFLLYLYCIVFVTYDLATGQVSFCKSKDILFKK